MPVPARIFTPEQSADIRHSYVETDEPVHSIAKRHGTSEKTLQRMIRKEGWPRRRQPVRTNMLQPAPPPVALPPPAPTVEDEAAIADIEATAHHAVAAICMMVARLPKARNVSAVERTARALATLIRTLQEVIRLRAMKTAQEAPEPHDDRGPPNDEEFFRRLHQRLLEFATRRRARVLDDPDAAAG